MNDKYPLCIVDSKLVLKMINDELPIGAFDITNKDDSRNMECRCNDCGYEFYIGCE